MAKPKQSPEITADTMMGTPANKPVKPPKYARQTADQRRRMLVDAAIHCLAEGGIAAFTIDTISRQADVSRGLINHHFKGIEIFMLLFMRQ